MRGVPSLVPTPPTLFYSGARSLVSRPFRGFTRSVQSFQSFRRRPHLCIFYAKKTFCDAVAKEVAAFSRDQGLAWNRFVYCHHVSRCWLFDFSLVVLFGTSVLCILICSAEIKCTELDLAKHSKLLKRYICPRALSSGRLLNNPNTQCLEAELEPSAMHDVGVSLNIVTTEQNICGKGGSQVD